MGYTKGILVVSFGTTYRDAREHAIEAIEHTLAEHFPDRKFYRAWTSSFIIRRVREAEGLVVDTPRDALEAMVRDGITDVLVQPTHLSDGYENQRMLSIVREYEERFDNISIGRPLLCSEEDRAAAAQLLPELFPEGGSEDTALFLMGHGSQKHPVDVYEEFQRTLLEAGADNVFIGTVEGTPEFEDAAALLDRSGCKNVILAPLMIVAGDHARNDLAGDDDDAWKRRLAARGYRAEVIMKGLGEFPQIREMFVRHAQEAESIKA